MNFGLRTIVLLVATALFIIALFVDDQNYDEWLALGLATFSFAFVTEALGWADRTFGTTTTRRDEP